MPAFMRAVICKYTAWLRCSEKNSVLGKGEVPKVSRHEEGCCDSERVVDRVGCFRGTNRDSNTDGLALKFHQ